MSRIHEALKKAEQEREALRSEGISVGRADETMVAAPVAQPAVGVMEEEPPAPIDFEVLLSRCSNPKWNPEPKIAELFSTSKLSSGAEELRTLRSRLYQIRERQTLRTILITSALPAEGKTFLSASLANMIVRQHERRALLIDADLRRSQLHLALGAPAKPGLTDYLMNEADEFSIVQRAPNENLFFIPGGKPVSNSSELLANGRFRQLLDRLSSVFDWILVDSPPVVPVHDAAVLAPQCDGVLLVVRAATTPFELAQKARTELHDKGLLGVVLNQVEEGHSYHSYYYHYYGKNGGSQK